ncbi:hypothetical protein LguiB_000522 [Lonicera macranthoides]
MQTLTSVLISQLSLSLPFSLSLSLSQAASPTPVTGTPTYASPAVHPPQTTPVNTEHAAPPPGYKCFPPGNSIFRELI